MLTFRPLNKNETRLLKTVAGFEKDFPKFYRDAGNLWTTGEDEIVAFYRKCGAIYGIFEKNKKNVEKIVGMAYFEQVCDAVFNVHCDLKRGLPAAEIIPVIAQIRDYQFLSGMRLCYTFTLKRNRPVRMMMEAIGFKPTFLKMYRGTSHGRLLEWEQLAIAPDSYYKSEVVA
jgi:hypothetical protein